MEEPLGGSSNLGRFNPEDPFAGAPAGDAASDASDAPAGTNGGGAGAAADDLMGSAPPSGPLPDDLAAAPSAASSGTTSSSPGGGGSSPRLPRQGLPTGATREARPPEMTSGRGARSPRGRRSGTSPTRSMWSSAAPAPSARTRASRPRSSCRRGTRSCCSRACRLTARSPCSRSCIRSSRSRAGACGSTEAAPCSSCARATSGDSPIQREPLHAPAPLDRPGAAQGLRRPRHPRK